MNGIFGASTITTPIITHKTPTMINIFPSCGIITPPVIARLERTLVIARPAGAWQSRFYFEIASLRSQ